MTNQSKSHHPASDLDDSLSTLDISDASKLERRVAPEIDLGSDNRAIKWSKALFFLALAGAAAILGYLTHYYVQQEEVEDFENQFASYANEIIEISQENVKKVLGVLEGLGVAATSHALHNNESFPFVTIPNFDERGASARRTSHALVVAYMPIVSEDERLDWERYSVANQDWIQRSHGPGTRVQPIRDQIYTYEDEDKSKKEVKEPGGSRRLSESCADETRRQLKERVPEPLGAGPYTPVWLTSPTVPANDTATINYNLLDKPVYKKAVKFLEHTRKPVFLDVCNQAAWFGGHFSNKNVLQTAIVQPIFASFEDHAELVGTLVAILPWSSFFENVVVAQTPELRAVLSNTCDEVFTFSIQGHEAKFLEEADLHDSSFDHLGLHAGFAEFANPKELNEGHLGEHCVYTLHVYPTNELKDAHLTQDPTRYCLVVLAVFAFTSVIFVVYDKLVEQRQIKLLRKSAKKNEEIVCSLFPEQVRGRLFDANEGMASFEQTKLKVVPGNELSKPIADLFPAATVMFCDVVGFTAWSSVRQPDQVFTFLETIYHSFDIIAEKKRVFKVETVGDSYIAVSGVPDPRDDHAVVMASFARSCMVRFHREVNRLALDLGPDTASLNIRCGLHSGPVTGGVLRGTKARYQLFGGTVNAASRMESTGCPGKIQVSSETAQLIREAGKEEFLEPRIDLVEAKGLGSLETWFLKWSPLRDTGSMHGSLGSEESAIDSAVINDGGRDRLIEWMCSLLLPHLKAIQSHRRMNQTEVTCPKRLQALEEKIGQKFMVLEEIKEVIDLPVLDCELPDWESQKQTELDKEITDQLKSYVATLAFLNKKNPFHCWEHACHVTTSMSKSLARIVKSDPYSCRRMKNAESMRRRYTYGISDPLSQFAILLSGVMHDVDHKGVPNSVLNKENAVLAKYYKGRSLLEQNSVDLAWEALMSPEFEALRGAIYCNDKELQRFRSLIVNSIMATDIFDPELTALRKKRWNKVFDASPDNEDQLSHEDVNRRATLVIEYLVQASDVAHTMQHWEVYLEWNARLFKEMHAAFVSGRSDDDPSLGWYQGELRFFDNYIIPLAKKLKDCGVFGVSGDEYLDYARSNRTQWRMDGENITAMMVANVSKGELTEATEVCA